MEVIEIRLLSANDAQSVFLLCERAFQNISDVWNKDMILSAYGNGNFFVLGAYSGGLLAGCILYSVAADTADIEIVATDPDLRRKGIGAALIREAEIRLSESGVSKVFLEVRAGNEPAVSLYEKCGFIRISVRKKYYKDGEDALLMVKDINNTKICRINKKGFIK